MLNFYLERSPKAGARTSDNCSFSIHAYHEKGTSRNIFVTLSPEGIGDSSSFFGATGVGLLPIVGDLRAVPVMLNYDKHLALLKRHFGYIEDEAILPVHELGLVSKFERTAGIILYTSLGNKKYRYSVSLDVGEKLFGGNSLVLAVNNLAYLDLSNLISQIRKLYRGPRIDIAKYVNDIFALTHASGPELKDFWYRSASTWNTSLLQGKGRLLFAQLLVENWDTLDIPEVKEKAVNIPILTIPNIGIFLYHKNPFFNFSDEALYSQRIGRVTSSGRWPTPEGIAPAILLPIFTRFETAIQDFAHDFERILSREL